MINNAKVRNETTLKLGIMKKKDLTKEYLLDMWLGKYHNTSIQQLLKENPEWEEHPQEHTREFYDKYKATKLGEYIYYLITTE